MRLKRRIFLSILTAVAGLTSAVAANAQNIKFTFGSDTLIVPSEYVITSSLPKSITGFSGDNQPSQLILLRIPFSVFDIQAPEHADMVLSLSSKLNNRLSLDAYNAWNKLGLHTDRIFTYDEQLNLYRFYPNERINKYWNIFKVEPSEADFSNDNWIARCSIAPYSPISGSKVVGDCDFTRFVGDVRLEWSIPLDAMGDFSEHERKVLQLIEKWKR